MIQKFDLTLTFDLIQLYIYEPNRVGALWSQNLENGLEFRNGRREWEILYDFCWILGKTLTTNFRLTHHTILDILKKKWYLI